MAQVLSKEEVKNLTESFESSRSVGTVARDEAIPYQLAIELIIRGRLPTLDIIHDRMARMFRITLSGALRMAVDMRVVDTKLLQFGEWVDEVPTPTPLSLFSMDPLPGNSILAFEHKFIFWLLEKFYGGPDDLRDVMPREQTPIEQRLVKRVKIALLADLQTAWRPVFPLQIHYRRTEINPMFIAIVPKNQLVVKIGFEILGKEERFPVSLIIPYTTLAPIRSLLELGFQGDRVSHAGLGDPSRNRLLKNIESTTVTLTGRMPGKSISIRDFINLREGASLMSERNVNQPIDILLNGKKKMTGQLTEDKGRQIVQVDSIFEAQVHDEMEQLRQQALKIGEES